MSTDTPQDDRAYFAHDYEEFVCWDCATSDERKDPAPDGDAVGEKCLRCDTTWEYVVEVEEVES